jgi:ATP-dependent Clp protease adaptor protein ClpS
VAVGALPLVAAGCYGLQNGHGVLGLAALAGVALLLLLPGFLVRHYWAELQAGFRDLSQRNYVTSKFHSERFLAQLEESPWLRKLAWLGTTIYSRNPEVLARNNLGAAMRNLGEIEPARAQLARAIELDPLCPLPYHNMGVLVLHTATSAEAVPWLEKAKALGLKKGLTNSTAAASQSPNIARAMGLSGDLVPPAPPPKPRFGGAFRVDLANDDVTPLDFVVSSLEQVFGLTGAEAIRIARAAHRDGWAGCAGFETEAAAQEKADQLLALARAAGFPLSCTVVALRPVLW